MLTQGGSVSSAPPLVVFVAPHLAETTLRFVGAVSELDAVRLALVSQDGVDRIPPPLRRRLAAYDRIEDALDPERIARSVAELARAGGKPRRLLGALEQLQVPLAMVRERLGIDGMGVEAATNFRDKSRMKDVLRAAGVPCARHALAGSAADARAAAERLGFPIVAKPPAGAAARNTHRVDDARALEQLLAADPPRSDRPLLLEEFVVGDEHSFDAVTVRGRPVWHSLTHYTPGPLEVLENPWIQWTVLLPREVDHPRYDDIRAVAARALVALGADTGLSHMEWFRRADGSVAVSEIAARPPGAQFTTLISWAHDVDFYRAWARLVVLDRFDPPPRRYAAGIAFLRGQGQGRVRAIHGLDRAQSELGSLVVEVRLPRAGQEPGRGYEGDGWVVLRHPDTATVAAALRRVVTLVRVELG
jgi:biotin carboxylase